MRNYMVLICMFLASSACAQQGSRVGGTSHNTLYPFLNHAGKFGYVDENLQVLIEPQYKMADLFTGQGFAVVSDSQDRKGVIDKNNQVILPIEYEYARLFPLKDFTLAEVYYTYYSRWRFWDWQFLPGFSLMGNTGDSRLFDTKVKRIKKTVYLLGDQLQQVESKRLTDKGYVDTYFRIKTLANNQVLIEDRLYDIGPKRARLIASGVKESLNHHTFAQQKKRRLQIVDQVGKRIDHKNYHQLDYISFTVADEKEVIRPITRGSYGSIADAYQGENGQTFIYPDFSKPLPQVIHPTNMHPDDPTAEELIRGLWLLASVPESDYFLFMSFRDGERFFRFLDAEGNWHQNLPPHISFTVVRPSGDIMWPAQKHYISPHHLPEGWRIDRLSVLRDSKYHITLSKAKEVRQGIWDLEKEQWLIIPEHYEVYPMNNHKYWRFHIKQSDLWGILDEEGQVLRTPIYSSLRSNGLVTQKEDGDYVSFYLHPTTLKELRER